MILKLEPYSGISGDMFLGALAPLLDAEQDIIDLPAKLGLEKVTVTFEDVIRSTIRCRKATVSIHGEAPASEQAENHVHHHDHSHDHPHDPPESHHHDHHHHHSHDHSHRAYVDIVDLIKSSDLTEGTQQLALAFFHKLGEAESEMHGIPLEKVHFHEVGSEDAIVDLVGAAVLIDKLRPEAVYATPVSVGSGFVKTAHGRLPVPAPATQKLLEGFPTFPGPIEKEMCTPTGAAILAVLKPDFSMPTLITECTMLGAGTRDLSQPNALRASLCRQGISSGHESITQLETNLDNVTGEDLGADFLQDLLEQGALDAWVTPILMKKGRPGQQLHILCPPAFSSKLSNYILEKIPTLGIRQFEGKRSILSRETRTVTTEHGDIEVKIHQLPDGSERYFPEYESCRDVSDSSGIPLQKIRDVAKSAAMTRHENGGLSSEMPA